VTGNHVFISYARADEPLASRIADQLRSHEFEVWRDDELPVHRAYAEVIEERIVGAKAVLVLWSAEAAKSQWVRAEADSARSRLTLVQATLDGTIPPLPFNQIQCADLKGWDGEPTAPGWRKLVGSVSELAGTPATTASKRSAARELSVCVLPFQNMSGDPEQEYFSDGISEDITTDLSQVSALEVIARNTAFTFKGRSVNVCEVARELEVTHVLEGSVRKVGDRVRINAQLIDGRTGGHVWAERYDRDLTDIFAIQDEISKAIVAALRVKLLPDEKKAIEARGTSNIDAYNLYLMARQHWITGSVGDIRRDESVVRICNQALSYDPNYAQAWALMALAQAQLRLWHGKDISALPAAEKALSINPDLAEARCVRAQMLEEVGKQAEAQQEIDEALRLDPESWEVNREAARLTFRQGRIEDAIPYFEKAAALMQNDWHNPLMLTTCFQGLGDQARLKKVAKLTVERAELAIGKDPSNASALAGGANALAILGEAARAHDWIDRALLLEPDNLMMRYNLACALAAHLKDNDRAIDVLQAYFEGMPSPTPIKHLGVDPDLDCVRDDPRFKEMLASAMQRLGMDEASA
jgi:adenylate cyclase